MSSDKSIQLPAGVKDIAGKPFGKLTAVNYAGTKLGSQAGAYWHCRCECGTEKIISAGALRSGSIQSCGCSKQRTDETGHVYNKLTVLEFAGNTNGGDSRWLCLCECGNTTTVARGDLRNESIKSCGCHRANARGMCKSPEYTSWKEMKRRCYNPKAPYYEIYGGRGISVCQRWLDAFVSFLDDMGPKPFPSATIHRIDGDSNYEPGNCKWASKEEQGLHTSKTMQIMHKGELTSMRGLARKLGIVHHTIARRLKQGWTTERIIEHYST